MSGYTPDRRPYEVWAKTATQDVTDPDHVELKTLRAKVLMEDQSTVTLDALNGLMDTKQQLLDLHKDIYLQTSAGYEAWLSQAFVDMGKGTVTSDEHVDVKWADGTLSADKMKITGGGEVVRFDGHVVMNIDKLPPAESAPQQPAAPAPEAARPVGTRPVSSKSSNLKSSDDYFPAQHSDTADGAWRLLRRRCARDDRCRRSHGTERGDGRAQCDAGFFAESRPADTNRSSFA